VVSAPEWLGVQVDRAEKSGQLCLVQKADIRAWLHDRRVDELARVLTAPPFPPAEDEDLIEELEGVGDRLGRLAVSAHACQECLDLIRADVM
jgi:hypothetical protein